MATPKEIFEEKIAKSLATKPDVVSKIAASYQFDLQGPAGGTWTVDLTKKADFVTAGPKDGGASVTINMKDSDFVDMVEGRLNGQMAFMQGKLKLKGDMSLALKLQQILG